jgi:hypothetical protein
MPRLQTIDIDPVDVDADGIATAQTPAAGGAQNLTLDGALSSGGSYTSGDGAGRQISVTAAANDSARTLTITGTDSDGNAQTETMTGAELNITTTESAKYWNTVTQVSVDDDTAGNISVGTVDELASRTMSLNRHASTGALFHFNVTGTIDVTVQVGAFSPTGFATQADMPWMDSNTAALVNATANQLNSIETHATAFRLLVNSYSSGAEVQVYLSQGFK